jgi:hypothetical protein
MSKLNLNQLNTENNKALEQLITSQSLPVSAVPTATSDSLGAVKPDNSTIIIDGGTVSANTSTGDFLATSSHVSGAISTAVSGLASEAYVSSYIAEGGYVDSAYVSTALEAKQDVISATGGIAISSNVISAVVDGTTIVVNSSGQLEAAAGTGTPAFGTMSYFDVGSEIELPFPAEEATFIKVYKNGVLLLKSEADGDAGSVTFPDASDPSGWSEVTTLKFNLNGTEKVVSNLDFSSVSGESKEARISSAAQIISSALQSIGFHIYNEKLPVFVFQGDNDGDVLTVTDAATLAVFNPSGNKMYTYNPANDYDIVTSNGSSVIQFTTPINYGDRVSIEAYGVAGPDEADEGGGD